MGANRCASKHHFSNRFSSLVDEDECVGSEPNVDVVRQEAREL